MNCYNDPEIIEHGYALINFHNDLSSQLIDNLCYNINFILGEKGKKCKVGWVIDISSRIVCYLGNYNDVKQEFITWLPWLNEYFCDEQSMDMNSSKNYYQRSYSEEDIMPELVKTWARLQKICPHGKLFTDKDACCSVSPYFYTFPENADTKPKGFISDEFINFIRKERVELDKLPNKTN